LETKLIVAPVSTRNLAGTSFIFKSMYIPASLLEVLTPKYARLLVEMMQAFDKKLDDLQKDLEKVKRNQAGTQRNTRISDIKKDNECFKCVCMF
jgi:hypothetical protein